MQETLTSSSHSGAITFRNYMEQALQDPQNGFYAQKHQAAEHFFTAPELTPVFGQVLARCCAGLLQLATTADLEPKTLIELGAGDGRLAESILTYWKKESPLIYHRCQYTLIEKSQRKLAEAILKLFSFGERVRGYSHLESIEPLQGVFIANEFFDALPVHLLEKRGDRFYEVYVRSLGSPAGSPLTREGSPAGSPFAERRDDGSPSGARRPLTREGSPAGSQSRPFAELSAPGAPEALIRGLGPTERPCPEGRDPWSAGGALGQRREGSPFSKEGSHWVSGLSSVSQSDLLNFYPLEDVEEGERVAIPKDALRYLSLISKKLQKGYLLIMDYGDTKPQKGVRAFFRHYVLDPLEVPAGEADITYSLDFQLLMDQAKQLGWEIVSYSPLSSFLLEAGIMEFLPHGEDKEAYQQRLKIKTLFHPQGMGEYFKALLLRRKVNKGE